MIFFSLVMGLVFPTTVLADGEPLRQELITIKYTEYEWWLVYWQGNVLACEILVDHTGEPTAAEIYQQCGNKLSGQWLGTKPCSKADSHANEACAGMYLHLVGADQKKKDIQVELPPAKARIELKDCITTRKKDVCVDIPSLLITAEEPLPNEKIIKIQGTLNALPFICYGNSCEVTLRKTDASGIPVEFWADSSYGDSTIHYRGRLRVSEFVDDLTLISGWQVDIASEMNDFTTVRGCAQIWQAFPALGAPPDWLSSPPHPYLLETDEPYTYLAGQLIFRGYVDVSGCSNFGLMANGYASQCGLEKARDTVRIWQNTFDTYLVQVARETGIPSQLLKRIFAKESQFWPETNKFMYYEYGPGHINELGADTVLLWNTDFYDEFCPLILKESVCAVGYTQLDDWHRAMLRGAFLSEVEINLPSLNQDLDQDRIHESVSLFSETLLGNCSQAGQIIAYETDNLPGEVLSYEDLWKLTLVNYHAGSGCLLDAVKQTSKSHQEISWKTVATSLEDVCPWALDYIKDIVQ
jgi:hypothetical protein